jgi:N-acetylneuraminic acid mutarotase
MRAVELGGLIYVVGGYVGGTALDGNTGACEAYDPSSGAWKTLAPMPTPRHGHTVVVLGGKLIVTGGGSETSARAETYDPSTDRWTSLSACPRVYPTESAPDGSGARRPFNLLFHEAVAWDGRILHFGAREHPPIPVLAWDPTDTWEIASERGPLRHRMASARIGTTLYLIGGENSAGEGPHALRDTLAVDLRAFARLPR